MQIGKNILNLKKNYTTHNKCRACLSKEVVDLYNLKKTPLEDVYLKKINRKTKLKKYPTTLSLCRKCCYVFLKQTVNPDLSYKRYIYKTSTTSGLSNHYDDYAIREIKRFKLNSKSIVLDIGSNDGSLLNSFKKNNIKTLGVEPAKKISNFANKKKIKTINSYFNDNCANIIKKKYEKIDHITANYMLANVLDLNNFFENINKILSPTGVFVIETGYHPEQFKKYMFDYIYHEHFSYFTITFLNNFLKKHKMYIYDIKSTAPKGGSIKIYVKQRLKTEPIKKIVKIFLKKEVRLGVNTSSYFNAFFKKIEKKKYEVINLLNKLKKNKKLIVGIGASHSVTTLIYNFELNKYLNCLVDDNKIKHKTYSPGFNIPVYSTKKILSIKPDYLIILGWQHQNTIINKHKKLLQLGTKFIIPLPYLKIIK